MMKGVYYTTVTSEEDGQRLDNYLLRILKGVPKSHIYRLIRGGEVRVNKKRAKASSRLEESDMVRIPPVRTSDEPGEIRLSDAVIARLNASILHEDDSLLVINKPTGMAVHGGSGLSFGVIEALRHMRPEANYLELIHRIDRETSGCLLIAKKRSMLRAVQALFEAREVDKTYWTLSSNAWQGKQSTRIDVALQKNTLRSGERVVRVDPEGKPSQTKVRLLENYAEACWLEAKPKTGRTHQIRVHTAHIGHPIFGDEKYGKACSPNIQSELKKILKQRLYLHARAIQFNLQEKHYSFQADLDAQFDHALQMLRAM
jgi:23S rRNA pseudouridine955/2504/2580 synthase